jgi:hypothetical protein
MASFETQTVTDLCTGAMRLIGIATEAYTPTPYESNTALYTLNEIIDSWNVDGTMQVSMGFHEFDVGSGQQVYTVGPLGDFDVPHRPVSIEYAAFRQTTSSPNIDIPLQILNADEWASIGAKQISTTIPTLCYMDGQYPLANFYLWPAPAQTGKIILTYWEALSSVLTLNSTLRLPPGYARALRLDLAANIAPEYGKQMPQDLLAVLAGLKNNIAVANIRPGRTYYDAGVMGGGAYNILTDVVQG